MLNNNQVLSQYCRRRRLFYAIKLKICKKVVAMLKFNTCRLSVKMLCQADWPIWLSAMSMQPINQLQLIETDRMRKRTAHQV